VNYYNDFDKKACAWLRELIAAGELPPGNVDERSILEIRPDELAKYDQCHFFAGIGGWPLALRWAGLENATGIWTGSCPCQPLSCAGKRQGHADERHLWPAFHALISKCRPATVFGEQVASAEGREWLAGVRLDLEALEYAVGAADLPAASVGAPHIRQRLWWVADSEWFGRRGRDDGRSNGDAGGLHAETEVAGSGTAGVDGFWDDAVWIPCADGKERRIKPGLEPLAHGVPGRVALLRGAGNAIVPQVAAEFIAAWKEARQ